MHCIELKALPTRDQPAACTFISASPTRSCACEHAIDVVQGDMRDLSIFAEASFDLVFHPISNLYAPDVRPVWRECFRVLRAASPLRDRAPSANLPGHPRTQAMTHAP